MGRASWLWVVCALLAALSEKGYAANLNVNAYRQCQ